LNRSLLEEASQTIIEAEYVVAFTGAGISVESGIPPFRGKNGLWSKYDPRYLEFSFFLHNPKESWKVIKEIFFDFFGESEPNPAHKALARLEKKGFLDYVITQNIDNLHQIAGSKNVIEFHGNSQYLVCLQCNKRIQAEAEMLTSLPLYCSECNGLLKPDFIFFGEQIPTEALRKAFILSNKPKGAWLVIGTTGEIFPAAQLPLEAKRNNNTIIEINVKPSHFTHEVTDIFLEGKASIVMEQLVEKILPEKKNNK
jgi:NAD-dependent deacetylase